MIQNFQLKWWWCGQGVASIMMGTSFQAKNKESKKKSLLFGMHGWELNYFQTLDHFVTAHLVIIREDLHLAVLTWLVVSQIHPSNWYGTIEGNISCSISFLTFHWSMVHIRYWLNQTKPNIKKTHFSNCNDAKVSEWINTDWRLPKKQKGQLHCVALGGGGNK